MDCNSAEGASKSIYYMSQNNPRDNNCKEFQYAQYLLIILLSVSFSRNNNPTAASKNSV